MSIASLCVLRSYSNGKGWLELGLRKTLNWRGLQDASSACGQLGEGSELWKRRCAWKSCSSGGISTFPQLQQQQCRVRGGVHEVKRRMTPCAEPGGSSKRQSRNRCGELRASHPPRLLSSEPRSFAQPSLPGRTSRQRHPSSRFFIGSGSQTKPSGERQPMFRCCKKRCELPAICLYLGS